MKTLFNDNQNLSSALFEHATQGIIISNVAGEIIIANPFAANLFGYTTEEMQGLSIDQLLPDKYRSIHPQLRNKFSENPKTRPMGHDLDLYAKKKNGDEFPIEIGLSSFLNEDQRYIISYCIDISERKKNQEKIKKLNERIQLAQNSGKVGVWDWDILNNILTWDHNMYALYGIEEKDFGGAYEAWQNGLHTDDKEPGDIEIKKALKGEKKFDTSFRVVWPDGSIHYIKAFAEIIRNEAGEPIRMTGVNWDITHEKLTLQQLEDSKEQLKSVNEELESFSYSVSHDLRAPLRSITGFAQILQEDYGQTLDEEGNRLLNIIVDNTNRMGNLIDGLLQFSRLGRKEILHSTINHQNLVSIIIEEEKHRNPNRKIEWKIETLPSTSGDSEMIRQVWENYIINAVKYTRKKEIAFIEIGSEIKENETIFFVKDNGAGFNMKYYDKLFAVFQRLHSKDEFEGTGVGLPNVQKIVSRHGGRVWAEGEEDKGATFYFSLNN